MPAPPAAPPPSPSPSEDDREQREGTSTGRTSSGPGSIGPGAGRVKRPRYLLFALIMALVFGAGCWTEGCGRLAFYRGERDQSEVLNAAIKSDAERARAEALYQHYTDVSDAARRRAIPLAAATFVLGAALLALAARGLARKANTRVPLMQVVTAQALVVLLAFFLTPDVRRAELDWQTERMLIEQREKLPDDQYEQLVPMMHSMRHYAVPGWLVVRTLASALIVLALTRPRAREFFEAATGTLTER